MKSFGHATRAVAAVLLTPYLLSVMVMTPSYNWRYARDNGFLKWLLLGQIVPTAQALAWP